MYKCQQKVPIILSQEYALIFLSFALYGALDKIFWQN